MEAISSLPRPRRHSTKPALFHGLDDRGGLVWVGDLEEGGNTDLSCPYCKSPLTAKKGDIVTHHFAHTIGKPVCDVLKARAPRIKLPMYDSFDWGISPAAVRYLIRWQSGDATFPEYIGKRSMLDAGLIMLDLDRGVHKLSRSGKAIMGWLTMKEFCKQQSWLIGLHLEELEEAALRGGELEQTDLALYRATLDRMTSLPLVLSAALNKSGEQVDGFYQIGTDASVPHPVKVLLGRAHLLMYFRHRFADDLATLPGEKAQAFQFKGDRYEESYYPSVLRELALVPKQERDKKKRGGD